MAASDAFQRAHSSASPWPAGVVEQSHVGAPHLAVQLRREAVRRNVDHAPAARHRLPDQALHFGAIGPVVLFDDPCAEFWRRAARRRREALRMADRAIEVDDEAADGRGHQRCPERAGQRLRHDQRAGVVAAVGVEQRPVPPKQRPVGRGDPVAAVFAGDEESVDRPARHQRSSGSWRNTCRVPSLQSWLSAVKYASPSSNRRRFDTSRLSRS